MTARRTLLSSAVALGLVSLAASAQAQAPAGAPPQRIRGSIASYDAPVLSVVSREGPTVKITLPQPATVGTVKAVELSSIKPGDFIGTAAEPGTDGTLKAMEVLVFPEAGRGTGEGHYAWDLAPGTSMTNATVSAAVQANAGRELSLTYKGGSVKVQVPPNVPVVTFAPASVTDLKPGAKVFVVASKAADGSYSGLRVVVGTNGVNPPM